jgi:cytoskeletal protein RodZ
VARPLVPRRKKRRPQQLRSSLGLGALLVGLTAVNVYYFFLRHDTSVGSLMKPVSTSKTLSDNQSRSPRGIDSAVAARRGVRGQEAAEAAPQGRHWRRV